MNQRKAIPAKGPRYKASVTGYELVASHCPGSSGSAGREARNSQKIAARSIEKDSDNHRSFGRLQASRVITGGDDCRRVGLAVSRSALTLKLEIERFEGSSQ